MATVSFFILHACLKLAQASNAAAPIDPEGPAFYHKPSMLAAYQAEFDALPSEEEQNAFLEQMKEMQQKAWKHTNSYINWDQSKGIACMNELIAICKQRKAE
ncbi:hypothetical protein BT96DRAFT_1003336 [Gymnopus androsaceus JB14]|uniref:Uncharacterized protein n=1 Tax=Gymnopus androsaceus JB14 TaxID=1447944 RepID=A0A6A4GV51_9AGAR|nr:hypothetical protein BT96DRAFT_1003336 [Gymnopus androsaceus JB14]